MIKIKENILKALTMKKEAYLKQMIDINKLTADFTALKKPHEQQTEIKQLQKQMQAEATAAVSTVLYPTPSIK
jgi:hypothetical protein